LRCAKGSSDCESDNNHRGRRMALALRLCSLTTGHLFAIGLSTGRNNSVAPPALKRLRETQVPPHQSVDRFSLDPELIETILHHAKPLGLRGLNKDRGR